MANIITVSDVKKFIKLLKAGLEGGKGKEMSIYSSFTKFEGTDVNKELYVNLEFRFRCDPDLGENIMAEENIEEQLKEILKDL